MTVKDIVSKAEAKKVERWLAEAGKADGKGRRFLFYHNDPDGICSAAMLLRFFPGFESCVCGGPVMSHAFVQELIEAKPELIVFLDLPVDQEWKKLEFVQRSVPELRMIVIDHHLYEKNLNSDRVLHINSMFKTEAYIPCAYIIYRMLQQMGKAQKPLLWVAALGVIGDYGWDDCRDLMDECRRRYPKLLGKDAPKSKLGRAAEMISHAVALKGAVGARKSLEFMLRAKNFEDFIATPELGSWEKEVEEELERVIKRAEREKQEHPHGVLAFNIETKLGLNSEVATRFSESYPDSVIIVRRRLGTVEQGQWKLSIRCQSGRVNVGELTKRAVRGIGSGGGHAKAAGAMVNDWERFVKRFVSFLKK